MIRVERSYDDEGRVEIEPKSRAGRRTVPIVGALRDVLVDLESVVEELHAHVVASDAVRAVRHRVDDRLEPDELGG